MRLEIKGWKSSENTTVATMKIDHPEKVSRVREAEELLEMPIFKQSLQKQEPLNLENKLIDENSSGV